MANDQPDWTGNRNITNPQVPVNEAVFLCTATIDVSDLAVGGQVIQDVYGNTFGTYDGLLLAVYSAQGLIADYTPKTSVLLTTGNMLPNSPTTDHVHGTGVSLAALSSYPSSNLGISGPNLFNSAQAFNGLRLILQNGGAATITADTLTVWIYGIRAQTTLTNTTTDPVPVAPQIGAQVYLEDNGGVSITASSGSVTVWTNTTGQFVQDLYVSLVSTVTTTGTLIGTIKMYGHVVGAFALSTSGDGGAVNLHFHTPYYWKMNYPPDTLDLEVLAVIGTHPQPTCYATASTF